MKLIKRSEIFIAPNRQRKEFDPQALAELGTSIDKKSLMHAPVLRFDDGKFFLVAGERRLRAIDELRLLGGTLRHDGEEIPDDMIPYVTLGELSELEAEEAELEENLARQDLTWQEKAAAMAKLHALRSRQAQAEGRIHTVADTALEVKGRSDGWYKADVQKDLIVSRFLDNPEVAKAKTSDEALKILKRQENAQKNIQLAAAVGRTYSASIHEIYNTNCLTWMRAADEGIVDVILTDPPYGMGADSFGDGGGGRLANNEHHYKDDYDSWKALMSEWCGLAYRVAKPQAHAYVFCDLDNFHELKTMMQQAGWYVFRTPFICTKPNSGRVPLPDEGPRRQWEMLLYAIKGHKKTTAIYPDVITTTADAGLQHGAQKPVALYVDLLRRSVKPGDVILDSFGGSGTLLPAAHQFQCKAIVLEMNPEYYGICVKRAADLKDVDPVQERALGAELMQMVSQRG